MNTKEVNLFLKQFAKPSAKKASIQILNTFVPYLALLTLTLFLANRGVSYFLLLPLCIAAGCFMVRTFILFHDCCHKSFVQSSKWNAFLGNFFAVFVFTPYLPWQKEHNIHHGTVGNLDKRGIGDIWTLTVEEYQNSSKYTRFLYRLFRHPLFLFGIAPVFLFTLLNRFPKMHSSKKEIVSYSLTNLGILFVGAVFSLMFGLENYLMVQVTIIAFASSMGVWLFYIQHQFEEVYWEENPSWEILEASLKGSSFYKLPLVLEWISGYIGYHHIHHLNSRIPNYHLKASYLGLEKLNGIRTVTLLESFPLALLQFYDEKRKRLITYKEMQLLLRSAS